MQYLIILCVVIAGCTAAPALDADAQIIQYDNTRDAIGNYDFSFKTSNGIERSESGTVVNVGQKDEHFTVLGFYSYINDEGKIVKVYYTADENGYTVYVPPPNQLGNRITPSGAVLATLLG